MALHQQRDCAQLWVGREQDEYTGEIFIKQRYTSWSNTLNLIRKTPLYLLALTFLVCLKINYKKFWLGIVLLNTS